METKTKATQSPVSDRSLVEMSLESQDGEEVRRVLLVQYEKRCSMGEGRDERLREKTAPIVAL